MLKKSLESPADALCYDLEDSVAVQRKGEARGLVVDALNAATSDRHERFVRVNSLPTGLTQDDLEAVVRVLRPSPVAFLLRRRPGGIADWPSPSSSLRTALVGQA